MARYVVFFAYDSGLGMVYDAKTAENINEAYRMARGRPALIFPVSDIDEVCRKLREAAER